jgi:molybdopterin-guanine dinucleotide biosynthesis protein MobB
MVKVIPVAGSSGSGKTTFIRTLIPLLARYGPVGTVKHAGHHAMELPQGKDTTIMYEAGAAAVAGIDGEKTLITLNSTFLPDVLEILGGYGIETAVIEGFKSSPWPKVVIGDLDVDGCVLRNPEPADVIGSMDRFLDYTTLAEILRDMKSACGDEDDYALVTYSDGIFPLPGGNPPSLDEEMLSSLAGWVKGIPGVIAARVAIQHGTPFGGRDELLVAIAAENGDLAAAALVRTLSRCRGDLYSSGVSLRSG